MRILILLCTVVAAAVTFPADTYNPVYDKFDAKPLIENPRILKNYGKCFLDQGPCTPEGSDFKRIIPEALRTNCAKCTPKQRELVRSVVQAFKEKQPQIWEELVAKLDPKGEYTEAFNKFLQESN